MPELEVVSNAKPSIFGYPPKLEEKKDKTREKVEAAVLSITAKQKKKKGEKATAEAGGADSSKKDEKMDVVSHDDAMRSSVTEQCIVSVI